MENAATSVPPVYRGSAPSPMTSAERATAALLAAACLGVLVVATLLPPNPAGSGTHRLLGLPACGFLARFGLPCPSCGMTTSFSWMVRGNLAAAVYVQPMGGGVGDPVRPRRLGGRTRGRHGSARVSARHVATGAISLRPTPRAGVGRLGVENVRLHPRARRMAVATTTAGHEVFLYVTSKNPHRFVGGRACLRRRRL